MRRFAAAAVVVGGLEVYAQSPQPLDVSHWPEVPLVVPQSSSETASAPVAESPQTNQPVMPRLPLLDDERQSETLPLVIQDSTPHRPGVQPYGGGKPTDWWGCNGSPYRTGPGACDNWKVGCNWAVTVDGLVMSRPNVNLAALADQIAIDDPSVLGIDSYFEQFDRGPGGRVALMSQVPHYVGYQIQVVYEGIEEWNSSIVYEKQDLPIVIPLPPDPPNPPPFPEGTEQHRFHYRSSYHSGELNFVRDCGPAWRPFCGVRYIKFDDEINDFIDQQAQPPLAGPGNLVDVNPDPVDEDLRFLPIGPVTTTDRLNLFDIQNNLIGFQIGLIHDSWKVNQRFSLEGFVNAGVYHNRIKYTNLMGIYTTQRYADNTNTPNVNEARTDISNTVNNDVRELSEIAYTAEGSLSGVCRLNKCWALRAGYQVLWIGNIHLAEDAFLTGETEGRDLVFHGWHAGIECRR